jgi:hypothetical protein
MGPSLMHIFAAEKEIEDNIKGNTSIAYISPINTIDSKYAEILIEPEIKDTMIAEAVKASIKDSELYYHTAILVTSNWNKNDDVFRPDIIWAAKDTPVHKPTNLGHDSTKIIGHMTASWPIDEEGKVLGISDAKDLPPKFHILVGSVIYKVWPSSEEYEQNVEKLLEQIEAGEKYVSMECTFKNFDYAISSTDGIKFVERNEQTAFLSKYLRAYGGEGYYNDQKIGRAVKEISFCGKGYVDKPANPESVIFTKNDIADFSQAEFLNNLDEKILNSEKNGVISQDNENSNLENIMTDFYKEQLEEAKAQNKTLVATVDELKEKVTQSNVSKLEKEIESLTAQVKDMDEVLKQKSDEITVKATEVAEVKKKLDEVTKTAEVLLNSNKELSDKVTAVEAEKKITARTAALMAGGFTKEQADEKVKVFASLDDAQFDVIAKEIIEAKKLISKNPENPAEAAAEDLENVETKPEDEVTSAGANNGDFDITELAGKLSAELKTKDGDK